MNRNYWSYHDKSLKELNIVYDKLYKQIQSDLQNVLGGYEFNSDNLFNEITEEEKERVNKIILTCKNDGLLTGNFGNLSEIIYNKKSVKYNEILKLLIYSVYALKQKTFDNYEQKTMYEVANYYYREEIKKINKSKENQFKISNLPIGTFLILLETIKLGSRSESYNWKEYTDIVNTYNVEEIYKQVLDIIEQQKELKIDSNAINKQHNQRLCIDEDKISGAIDNELIALNNLSKIEAIKNVVGENAQVQFIAIEDNRTTSMCESLDGQIFNITGQNNYLRMYGETKDTLQQMYFTTNGLEVGLNLPPIDNHFHYCRSTVEYYSNNNETENQENDSE